MPSALSEYFPVGIPCRIDRQLLPNSRIETKWEDAAVQRLSTEPCVGTLLAPLAGR